MRVTISISEEVLKDLDRQADDLHRSRSEHIKELVIERSLYMTFKIGNLYKSYKMIDIKDYDDDNLTLTMRDGRTINYTLRYLQVRPYTEAKELELVLKK